jgi:hypothetical protein
LAKKQSSNQTETRKISMSEERELSFGEKAVGLTFNPGNNHEVDKCKREFAAVIDRMNYLRNLSEDTEVKRMASVAITEAQTAQMWAVKAITWQK